MQDGFWWIVANSDYERQGKGRASENLGMWITLDEATTLSRLKHYQGNDWPANSRLWMRRNGTCTEMRLKSLVERSDWLQHIYLMRLIHVINYGHQMSKPLLNMVIKD